jgi:hypothetical protein
MHDRQLLMQLALQKQLSGLQRQPTAGGMGAHHMGHSDTQQSEGETTADLMRNLKDAMSERRMPAKKQTPILL